MLDSAPRALPAVLTSTVRRPRQRQGEAFLSDAIREALSLVPGLRIWRNSVGSFHAHGGGRVWAGLPRGSADLVGVLSIVLRPVEGPVLQRVGRFVALEVKKPGEVPTDEEVRRLLARLPLPARANGEIMRRAVRGWPEAERHLLEQALWLEEVRSCGGFAAYVSSVEEARAAIERARGGASQ